MPPWTGGCCRSTGTHRLPQEPAGSGQQVPTTNWVGTMDEPQIVSLRRAAASIGMAASTLSAVMRVEPTLQAAVMGRGARGSLKIDLDRLTAAWATLQGDPGPEPENDRQRYRIERCRNLWWQLQGERVRLAETEAALVPAADMKARQLVVMGAVRAAALAWVEEAASLVPGLPTGDAQIRLQELAHAALVRLVDEHTSKATESAPAPVSLTFPADDPPTLWSLRGDLEAVRASSRRLDLLIQRGELVDTAEAQRRLFEQGRQLRDAWLRVAQGLALRARLLPDADSFKAAAIQELTAAGLLA